MGALRADARLIKGGGRRVVRVVLEPECVAVCLGASRSARRGSTGAGNRRTVFAPSVLDPASSPRTAGHPGCLSSLSSPLVSLSACPNASPVRVPARSPVPKSHASESGALWLFVRDSQPWLWKKRLRPWSSLRAATLGESVPSPFQPSFWALVGRARAATGEGRGLAARDAHPNRHPAPRSQGREGEEMGPGARARREGGLPGGPGECGSQPGGGARGRVPGHPGTFPPQGAGAGPPPPQQLRGPHVVADVTSPTPNVSPR